ncbi:MAG TPA: electron transfer flavoprotein subunit alpha/FixB family protein [Dehalococcoidia bacterium]|nr:electron transfer flavoprotein subunit alpha/FixB family protein [Dehalococcoidia bacterium]
MERILNKVLVLAELNGNDLDNGVFELLSLLNNLNVSKDEITVGVLGDNLQDKDAILKQIPCSEILAHSNIDTNNLNPNILSKLASSMIEDLQPNKILISKTNSGQDLAPRLAFKFGWGLVNDCLNIEKNENNDWTGIRPIFGGNFMAKINIKTPTEIYCVRPKVFDSLTDKTISPEIEYKQFTNDLETKTKVLKRINEQSEGIKLEDADIVIAGGRGLGGPEPFETLDEIAGLLNATVGASRAVCDAGWMDHSYQIGLTGKNISPNLYLTVAISGASQHMAGCSNSKHIVSIDKNVEANIFNDAEFGAIGDWKNILPGFLDTLKDLVKE